MLHMIAKPLSFSHLKSSFLLSHRNMPRVSFTSFQVFKFYYRREESSWENSWWWSYESKSIVSESLSGKTGNFLHFHGIYVDPSCQCGRYSSWAQPYIWVSWQSPHCGHRLARTPENPLRGRSKKKKSLSGLFLGPSYPDYRDYPDFLKFLSGWRELPRKKSEKREFIHIF